MAAEHGRIVDLLSRYVSAKHVTLVEVVSWSRIQ